MSGRSYKIIVAGYNCQQYVERCINSIKAQRYQNYSVCLVNDASTDNTGELIDQLGDPSWEVLHRSINAGALRSQHEGIMLMEPRDGDVIVWVDMDDAMAYPNSLEILDSHYEDDTPMTYGSYQSVPFADTCPPVLRYPEECERDNSYRDLPRWGIRYNHMRTVRWELYKQLDVERDFMFNGDWMHLASDTAVMIPCLEMSGGKYKVIPEILYNYSSDNPISEWRKAPTGTDAMHAYLRAQPRKSPVWI